MTTVQAMSGSDLASRRSVEEKEETVTPGSSDIPLSPEHVHMLKIESAIGDEEIRARGYRTVYDRKELASLGFASPQRRVPGLLLPLHPTDGGDPPLYVYRPDNPRRQQNRAGHVKVIKYEVPKGAGTRLDCPPRCLHDLKDPSVPLWITEGQKKADALTSHGFCAIALLGVWNWRSKNDLGGTTFLNDWDHVALDNRDVRIVFDSDVMVKPSVRKALERLTEHLQRKGARISHVYLPGGRDHKVGVDDWLAQGHTPEELEALVDAPRPEIKPASPVVEILDEAPPTLRRPLGLVNGRGYAATWLHCEVTHTETVNRQGELVALNPPQVTHEHRLFVVRDDGKVFGEGGDMRMADLDVSVHLAEVPPESRLWSARGVKRYRAGQRPDPLVVFAHVADVLDHFLDFSRSIADQWTMVEMVACHVLGTYFLDAFNVAGFLWPSGHRGSGKTQLILVHTELSYLGQVILAGGSYASLRDLADYGATLGFDDAENIGGFKRFDPDKRALLLAGNRRGAVISVKEPDGKRGWRTRHVNAYTTRLFSAIGLPDPVLASRTIVVPLIRTTDRKKANSQPLDYAQWPHDRRQLIDDLWATGLAHMATVGQHDKMVAQRARLTGRALEPWRSILAVALWLQDLGAEGLFDRMEDLASTYQSERSQLQTTDLTTLVIRGLCRCAVSAISAIKNTPHEKFWVLTVAEIATNIRQIAEEDDLDGDAISNRKVGGTLSRMRFKQEPRPGGRGSRLWKVTLHELQHWTCAYSLPLPPELGSLEANGTNGTDGTLAQIPLTADSPPECKRDCLPARVGP